MCEPVFHDNRPRTDGQPVHRTSPLLDPEGRLIGHACECRVVVLTEGGGVSQPQFRHPSGTVRENRAHRRRVQRIGKRGAA